MRPVWMIALLVGCASTQKLDRARTKVKTTLPARTTWSPTSRSIRIPGRYTYFENRGGAGHVAYTTCKPGGASCAPAVRAIGRLRYTTRKLPARSRDRDGAGCEVAYANNASAVSVDCARVLVKHVPWCATVTVSRALAACWIAAGCATASTPEQLEGGDDASVDMPLPPDSPPSPCQLKLATLGFDFESGASGWTHAVIDDASAPGWPLDEWQVGTATTGPGSCHGGTGCWATRLDANYTSCSRAEIESPPTDLSECSGQSVNLVFYSWHDFWTGTVPGKTTTFFDGGLVEVSADGSSWTSVTPSPAYPGTIVINPNISSNECVSSNSFQVHNRPGFVGAGGTWQQVTVALPAAVVTSTFRVRFLYSSGVSFANSDAEVDRQHTRPGWYVDDVTFSN